MTEFVVKHPDGLTRCSWPKQDPLYLQYHDTEWGVKLVGENELFEQLALEGFQAGLSWITILKRREGFRKAFHNFNIHRVAKMTDKDIEDVRNRFNDDQDDDLIFDDDLVLTTD